MRCRLAACPLKLSSRGVEMNERYLVPVVQDSSLQDALASEREQSAIRLNKEDSVVVIYKKLLVIFPGKWPDLCCVKWEWISSIPSLCACDEEGGQSRSRDRVGPAPALSPSIMVTVMCLWAVLVLCHYIHNACCLPQHTLSITPVCTLLRTYLHMHKLGVLASAKKTAKGPE